MCGRVIQSSGPLSYAFLEGMDVRDSRVYNYPPRWKGTPSQDLLVIRRNHHTGEVSLDPLRWGLIPYWCEDPKGGRKPINAKCETVRTLPARRPADKPRSTKIQTPILYFISLRSFNFETLPIRTKASTALCEIALSSDPALPIFLKVRLPFTILESSSPSVSINKL